MNWNEFESEITALKDAIDVVPDVVIGIARGGVIPAAILARRLDVKDMFVLKVRKEGNERRVVGEILADVSGKQILLVEDMLESGKSLVVAKKFLEEHQASVKTCCLYTMPITETNPDYSLREVNAVIHFPWE